jgi:hypothetical protein
MQQVNQTIKKTIIVHEYFTKYSSIMASLNSNFKIKGILTFASLLYTN